MLPCRPAPWLVRACMCRAALLLRGPVMNEEEANQLNEQQKANNKKLHASAKRRYSADYPVVRMAGPLPLAYHLS